MRTKAIVAALVGVFVAAVATAQESQLQLEQELYINVGKVAEFEAVIANRRARMARGNVTFPIRVSVSEGLPFVYRSLTVGLENMAALEKSQAQLDAMPANAPANQARAREAISHIESSLRRTRPDLSYLPDNPSVPIAEVMFLREANLYLRFGTAGDAAEIIKEIGALFEKHNVRNAFFVTAQVTGSGPDLRVSVPARNAAEAFAENQRVIELLGAEYQALAVLDLDTGAVTRLGLPGVSPHYVSTGHLVYAAEDGSVRAVPFDASSLEVTGNPVPLVEGVVVKTSGAANFSISDTGRLVYVSDPGGGMAQRSLVWVDRAGQEEPVGAPPRAYMQPRVSPDGTRLVFTDQDADNTDVWVYDLTRATSTRLTSDPALDDRPLWTPDGERVVFASTREGASNLFWRAADGTGPVERLATSSNLQRAYAWADDGQVLVYQEVGGETIVDIWTLPLASERAPEPLIQGPFTENRPALSPDDRWIAYASDESGQYEIYVQPFPDLGERWTISTSGGSSPVWGPDGRELFYLNGPAMMVVPIDTEDGFAPGNPGVSFEGQYLPDVYGTDRTYDIAPDGRFVMIKESGEAGQPAASPQLTVVLNWFQELTRLVPVP